MKNYAAIYRKVMQEGFYAPAIRAGIAEPVEGRVSSEYMCWALRQAEDEGAISRKGRLAAESAISRKIGRDVTLREAFQDTLGVYYHAVKPEQLVHFYLSCGEIKK